jgi:hypothetical protein
MPFDKLVRFELDGRACYGNMIDTSGSEFKVTKLIGGLEEGFSADGGEVIIVSKVSKHIFSFQLNNQSESNHMLSSFSALSKEPR